jgi:hypothetical protein
MQKVLQDTGQPMPVGGFSMSLVHSISGPKSS